MAVQPMMARAGSGEVHCDICALEAPGVIVGISVRIGGAEPAIADDMESTNTARREHRYRMTFSTIEGEGRYSPELWTEEHYSVGPAPSEVKASFLSCASYGAGGGTRRFVACSNAYASDNRRDSLHAMPVKLTPNGAGFASKPSGNGLIGALGTFPNGTMIVG